MTTAKMTKRKPTPMAEPQPQPDAASATDSGILANDHDVDRLGKDIEKLLTGLAERGVPINLSSFDLNNLRARIEGEAACRMLVAKGIATPAEMAAMSNVVMRELLAMVLQAVEEVRLKASGQQIVRGQDGIITPPGRGGLAVVKR